MFCETVKRYVRVFDNVRIRNSLVFLMFKIMAEDTPDNTVFVLTWKIENINLYVEETNVGLSSPYTSFKIGPMTFQIYLSSEDLVQVK